jgi:hypothetical protein
MSASESDMTHWKNMWSDIISDPDFREWISGKTASGYYQLYKNTKIKNETPGKKTPKKGTFYMKFGKLGHYVAYEIKKNSILIFDSSHSTGSDYGLYRDCLPDFMKTIQRHFSKNIEFVEKYGTPQVLPGDSFCQTWSLAYLLGTPTQSIMSKLNSNNQIEILYEICSKIIATPVFKEFCNKQKSWITTNFKENKAPKKWTPEFFLDFSRNVLDLESFRYLFA